MGYIAELNGTPVTQTLTLSSGAGTADFGAFPTKTSVQQIIINSQAGTTTAGATFTLKANGTNLADWSIPNGYNGGSGAAGITVKDPGGPGPFNFPAGAAGPLPATGSVTASRQVLPENQDIRLAVASGNASDVLEITLFLVPGGNLDNAA